MPNKSPTTGNAKNDCEGSGTLYIGDRRVIVREQTLAANHRPGERADSNQQDDNIRRLHDPCDADRMQKEAAFNESWRLRLQQQEQALAISPNRLAGKSVAQYNDSETIVRMRTFPVYPECPSPT